MTTMTTIIHLHIAYLCNEKFPIFTGQVQFGFWLQELLDVKQGFGKMLFCVQNVCSLYAVVFLNVP